MRILPKGKSFAEVNPELAKQWHPIKNTDLTPFDFTWGSSKKVWWKCPKGADHEWEASIVSRNNGRGCPVCSGNKVVRSTSLGLLNPELLEEWHPTKNISITPFEIKPFSNKKVWWKCPKGADHEWEAAPNSRLTTKSGCPICSGYKVVASNCLATTNPELAKQWHPTKNGNNTPYNCLGGSSKKIWWICPKGNDHIWKTSLESRTRKKSGCLICRGLIKVKSNSLSTTHPGIAKEWHPNKNGTLTPLDVTKGEAKKVWWKCDKEDDHEWQEAINNRTSGRNCPYCSGHQLCKSNTLIAKYPELAKELHPTKNNGINASRIYFGSLTKALWQCGINSQHVWEGRIFDRVRNKGCPYCLNMRVNESNCLATTHPELASQWHPTKNKNISALTIVAGSTKRVWWKCEKGGDHEWLTPVVSRANGGGCPICINKKTVTSNCLATTHPHLLSQWDFEANKELSPYEMVAGTNRLINWKCDKGEDHTWKASGGNRISGTNCPYCTLTPQSKQELVITFELSKFFNDIDPKGLKARVEGKIHSIDIFIPSLNLGVEFDGSYWHKGKRELDKVKTLKFEAAGFNIVRIREEPLKRIFATDIISKQPYNGKEITNELLKFIMSTYKLDKRTITMFEKYLLKDELQNQKALVNYIEQILTAKALEKKKRTTTKPKLH